MRGGAKQQQTSEVGVGEKRDSGLVRTTPIPGKTTYKVHARRGGRPLAAGTVSSRMKNVLHSIIEQNASADSPDIPLTTFANTSRVGELVSELTSELMASTGDARTHIMQRVNALQASFAPA